MNCEQCRPNLLAYLDGEVEAAQRAEIEAHLAACPACAAELARLQALRAGLLDAVPAGLEHVRLSRAAEERIRARLRRAQRRPRFAGALAGLLRPRLALARVAIPLIVALFLALTGLVGSLPVPVSAQETIVLAPSTLAPDTDAALRVIVRAPAAQPGEPPPIPNAEISVRLRPQSQREVVLYRGHTDQQGTADVRFHVPAYDQDNLPADLVVVAESPQGRDEVRHTVTLRRSFRVYLTSDKPLYQPGQTIHLRALALDAAQGLPAAGRRLLFRIQGTGGERILERTVPASGYGIAAVDYVLPPNAAHGTYRLLAALGDTLSTRTVTVGQYERPRFSVDLDVERPYYLPGERVRGQVTVHQPGGEPLPGAPIALQAYLYDPDQELIATLQGRTAQDGGYTFRFELPASLRTERANLALAASATGEAGNVEWAGRVVPVAGQPLSIDLVPEGGRLRPGVDNVLYVLAAAPDGTPVPAQLILDLAGSSYELETDAYGLAAFHFVPDPGTPAVQAGVTARTAGGTSVARTFTLSADQGPAQLLLRLDRAAYEVGETMHLEILAGQGDVVYLDVVQRSQGQAVSTHLAALRDGRARLDLDVSPQMAGTLELHAYQVLPGGSVVRDARLAVVDAPQQVEVAVQADRTAYQPGDAARVAIDTRLDGAPVQSALGIAVVDESVFALEDRAPGFAKLFFLLDESLLEASAHAQGVALPDLLDPPGEPGARAARDLAVRAAWARLPVPELTLERSSPAQAAAAAQARLRARFRGLGRGLAAALLVIPLSLWIVVVGRARRLGSWGPPLWRTSLVWTGLALAVAVPLAALGAAGLALLLGDPASTALLVGLAVAWLGTLVALGVYAGQRRDDRAQIALLLVAAYGVLGTLLGYVAERGGGPGLALVLGLAAAFLATLIALLLLGASFWVEGHRRAAGTFFVLVPLSVSLVVLAGSVVATSSLLAQTLTDPRAYAGPLSWLSGCAAAPKTAAVEQGIDKQVRETVAVEKEVEKEAAKTTVEVPAATPLAQATPTAAAVPQPTATVLPPARPAGLPLPLIDQVAPETIYWLPEEVTGEDGHLEIEIPLPGVEATWRLTVLASTRSGQLGAATATLRAHP